MPVQFTKIHKMYA